MYCKICNKDFNHLGRHLRAHNIKPEKYYEKYIGKSYCKHCGKNVKFLNLNKGYRDFCSIKCAQLSPITQNKIKKTCLERYDVTNVFASKYGKDKIKNTLLERYNVDNISKAEYAKKQKKATMLKNYGYDNSFSCPELRDEMLKTVAERYNDGLPVINTSQAKSIKQKVKHTCLSEYGVDNVRKSKKFINKIISTKLTKKQKFEQLHNCTSITTLIRKYGQGWLSISKEFRRERLNRLVFIGNEHLNEIINYKPVQSKFEEEVFDFVSSLTKTEKTRKVIKPLELDIYCPNEKAAIECNGLYWHSSEAGVPKNYHLNKTKKCEKLGIKLVHIFEDDWYNKNEICKSIIRTALCLVHYIDIDDCIVKTISLEEEQDFIKQNSLKSILSDERFGVYYKNELVLVVSKNHYTYTTNKLNYFVRHNYKNVCYDRSYEHVDFTKTLKPEKLNKQYTIYNCGYVIGP